MPEELPTDLKDLLVYTNQKLVLGTQDLPLPVASAILEQWIPMMNNSGESALEAISANALLLKGMIDSQQAINKTAFNALLDAMHAQLLAYAETMTEEGEDDGEDEGEVPPSGPLERPKRYRKHMSRMAWLMVIMRLG